MLKNIFRLSIRNFFNNKINSIVIVISLSVGLTVANILIGFTVYELNTDNFHKNRNRIYRLLSDDPFEPGQKNSYILRATVDYMENHFPGIEESCMVNTLRQNGISRPYDQDRITGLSIVTADENFFRMFSFPFYRGNADHALDKGNIVLTVESAKRIFGPEYMNAGEIDILCDTTTTRLNISGFTELPTGNSHLKFDAIVRTDDVRPFNGGVVYFLLQPEKQAGHLADKVNQSGDVPGLIGEGKLKYYFQPLNKIYWDNQNSRTFSKSRDKIFIWAGWSVVVLVLFMASFNFLNLIFISFLKRFKEFGIKKILGATMKSFLFITVAEVFIYILVSYTLSLAITRLFLPYFDSLLSTSLSLRNFLRPEIMIILGTALLVISIASVFKLSAYFNDIKPVNLLSGKSSSMFSYNQWMLGMQFFISIVLIFSSTVMIRQVQYIREKPLGFNTDLLEMRSPSNSYHHNLISLKQAIISLPGVRNASVCSGNPVSDNMIALYYLENGETFMPYLFLGDEDYLKTMGISLIEGTMPRPEKKNERIVNQEFVRHFQMENPVGTPIPGEKEQYICGVVKDFNVASLKNSIPPVILGYSGDQPTLILHYEPGRLNELIPLVREKWEQLFPWHPYNPIFISEELRIRHAEDIMFSRIIVISTVISIIISCFGLFALTWGTAGDRSREIGIRKILGATWLNITVLLLRVFLKWILIAYAIAIPVAWYLVHKWLETFQFKIEPGFWIFIEPGIIILTITLLTIGHQIFKSGKVNPVDELKCE